MLSSLAITHTPVLSVLVTHPGQARTHTAAGPYRKALGKDGRRRSTYNAHTRTHATFALLRRKSNRNGL